MVLPPSPTVELSDEALEAMAGGVAGVSAPENDNRYGKIIAKGWRDPAFEAELIANPAAAQNAESIDAPAGMAATLLASTDKRFLAVLPPSPSVELSDETLDAVAGLDETS